MKQTMFADEFIKKIADYKGCFIAALISYCFVYGFELTHFTLSIDEEFRDNFLQTLMLGRWGHAFLRHYVLPEPFVPFFTTALSILFLTASAFISAIYLKLNKTQSIVFAIMLAALPQFAYQMEFENQSETVALSLMLSSLSLTFLHKGTIARWITFVLLTVLSLSIYQSVFLYAASLLCVKLTLDAVREDISFRDIFKSILIYCIFTLIALAINSVLSNWFASIYNAPSSNYLAGMIGWGHKNIPDVILDIAALVKQHLNFTNFAGLNSFPFAILWVLITIASSAMAKRNLFLVSLCCIVTFLSAFALIFAIGAGIPPRSMTNLPVVFSGLFVVAMVSVRKCYIPLIFSVIFLLVGASTSNGLFYSDYMARKSDDQLGKEIVTAIYNKYPQFEASNTPVFFYGSHTPYNSWRMPASDVFGYSFFEWDGGNNRRIYAYLSTANIANFAHPNPQQVDESIKVASGLPVWPNRDSVHMNNGVVIVKIGPNLSPLNK